MQVATNLVLNTSFLVSISIIFNLYFQKIQRQKVIYKLLGGVILGLAGIVLMTISLKLPNDVIFDTRSILISISGLFYGFLPTSIAAAIVIGYRVFLGGPGTITGIAVTLSSAVLGILWRFIRKNPENLSKLEYYGFGVVNHIIMLLCIFLLPKSMIDETLRTITLPVLTIYPIGTLILCLIITYERRSLQTERSLSESEVRFQAVCERAPVGIIVGIPGRIIYANSEYSNILGLSLETIKSVSWKTYTHPDDIAKDAYLTEQLLSGKIDQFDITKRYIRNNGEIIWVHLYMSALQRSEKAELVEYVCIIQNITKEVEREHYLVESERAQRAASVFLETLLNSIPDHIFYKDKQGVYLGCNKAFEVASGISRDALVGHHDFEVYDEETAQAFIEADRIVIEGNEQLKTEESVVYPNGERIYTETVKTRYYDAEGEPAGLIGISRDITDRKRRQERIEFLSAHDIMTGLFNRMYFDAELDRIDSSQQLPYSLISVDIDSLKLTNDLFGHSAGDKLIVQTADLLKACCGNGIIARMGGDEFSILLPGVDEKAAKDIASRIASELSMQVRERKDTAVMLSISLGYATKVRPEQTIAEITNTAEEHMYRRKLLNHKSIRSTLLSTMKELLFSKGNETKEHADRMANLAKMLGTELRLNESDRDSLELMATLHDIGKIGISSHILAKPGALDDAEWLEIRKHPEIGYRIALTIPELQGIADYILCHHERWDGKGYPQGLAGQDIPYISRIISVLDAFDAMTADRVYRKAIAKETAIEEIQTHAGTQFDPEIANAFIKCVQGID